VDPRAVRKQIIAANLSRKVVNARVNRVRRIFKWGVENELVASKHTCRTHRSSICRSVRLWNFLFGLGCRRRDAKITGSSSVVLGVSVVGPESCSLKSVPPHFVTNGLVGFDHHGDLGDILPGGE